MAGNLVKKVMLKIVADDGDSEAKLDRISAKADELGRQHPELTVRINSAAASAKLAVLRQELKATAAAADNTQSGNFFTRLASSIVPAIGQMGMAQKIMLGLGAATSFAEPLVAGLTVATMSLASSLAAAGGGLGIFAAVAKGAYQQVSQNIQTYTTAQYAAEHATTAAARTTALKQMQGAWNGLTASQKDFAKSIVGAKTEWQNFVTSATPGIDKLVHQGLGLLPSLFRDIRPVLAPVEGALHGIVSDLGRSLQSGGLKTTFEWIAHNAPAAITGLAHAIGNVGAGLGGMLRAFTPASHGVMSGLDDLTAKFAKWGTTLGSHSGFQSLMQMFHTETPLAVHDLGLLAGIVKTVIADMTGLSGVGNSKTLLQLANPVLTLVNALARANPALVRLALYGLAARSAISKIGGAVGGIKGVVGAVQTGVKELGNFRAGFGDAGKAADEATGAWGTAGGRISTILSGVGSAASTAWSGVSSGASAAWSAVQSGASAAGSMVTGFAGKIGTAVTAIRGWSIWSNIASGATKVWTGIQAAFDVVMDANPIFLVVGAVAALIGVVVLVSAHVKALRDFWKAAWHDITAVIGDAISWVKGHWPVLMAIMTGGTSIAVQFIISHWHDIVSGAEHMISDVLGFFRRLPGNILHALGDLGSLLWHGGVNLIMGLVHGIESVASAPLHALGSVVSGLRSLLPFSPAKTGPLSGSGSPDIAGRKIPQMLAQGITAGSPQVQAAALRMAAMAAGAPGGPRGAGAGYGAYAGGGKVVLEFAPGGGSDLERALWNWLVRQVRVKGGGTPDSVQRALGQGI